MAGWLCYSPPVPGAQPGTRNEGSQFTRAELAQISERTSNEPVGI